MESPWSDYLNPTVKFFNIAHLYTKTKPRGNGGGYEGADPVYVLYEAKEKNEYPPILIVDKKSLVNIREPNISLTIMGDGAINLIEEYLDFLPERVAKRLIKLLQENAVFVKTEEWITDKNGNQRKKNITPDFSKLFAENELLMQPKPLLKDLNMIRGMDWLGFVDKVIRWEALDKDPRLNLIDKCHLLKGVEPRANAHALEVFNAGVGKSIHFIVHGINFDKALKNAFLGFAKSPVEIYKGTVDGTELPIGIDQVEVGTWGIMDFMFNVMEYGKSRVSSGSVDFEIESKSSFAILANPLGEVVDLERGFGVVLDHLTKNPAIGRRFGIIGYSKKYAVIKTRSTPASMDQWKMASMVFRAVEQSAQDKLKKIYQDKETWDYLGKEIMGYQDQVEKLTKDTQNSAIKSFLREHGSAGQVRVRAAALSASLVDYLNEVALGEYELTKILEHADEILPNISQINLESIGEMVENLDNEIQFYALGWLRNAPSYLREIIYAVEQTRRQKVIGGVFILNHVDYKPSTEEYTHISQCILRLTQRKRGIEEYAEKCQKWFNFIFKPNGKELEIILERPEPILWIEIPSRQTRQKIDAKPLTDLTDLTDSTESTFRQTTKMPNNIRQTPPETENIKDEPPKNLSASNPSNPSNSSKPDLKEYQRRIKAIIGDHEVSTDYIISQLKVGDEEGQKLIKVTMKDGLIFSPRLDKWRYAQ